MLEGGSITREDSQFSPIVVGWNAQPNEIHWRIAESEGLNLALIGLGVGVVFAPVAIAGENRGCTDRRNGGGR